LRRINGKPWNRKAALEDSVVDPEDSAVDLEGPVVDPADRTAAPEDQEVALEDREGQAGSVRGCLSLQP
jgi:hypothetical protein